MAQKDNQTGEKVFSFIGRLKVYGDIARYYLNIIQFVLIAIAFVKVMEYSIALILILIGASSFLLMGIVYFHVKYIMPYEFDYINRRDRVKMETLKAVKK